MSAERGCGFRVKGAIYAEVALSPKGTIKPLDCLLDPPILVPPELNLSDVGVKLWERDGVWHIIDRVGFTNYPNVLDFVLEAFTLEYEIEGAMKVQGAGLGISRKLSPYLDY